MLNKRYKIIGNIGEGGFAKVFLAEDTQLNIKVALKRYDANKFVAKIKSHSTGAKVNTEKYSVLSEIKRGIGLTHTNLIRYYDAFNYTENGTFGDESYEVGVMEYLPDGDWFDFLERHSVKSKEFDKAFMGVLEGLHFLHSKGIVHRDIKPPNILFDNITPKITDLGISKEIQTGSSGSSVLLGTVEYMSPEQISPTDFGIDGEIGYNTDLWSLGVILYKSFVGKMPFGSSEDDVEEETIRKNIMSPSYIIPDLDKIPKPYSTIVKSTLVRHASDRLKTIDEIQSIINKHHKENEQRPIRIYDDETVLVDSKKSDKKLNTEEQLKTNYKNYIIISIAAMIVTAIAVIFWPKNISNNPTKTPGISEVPKKQEPTRKSTPSSIEKMDKPVIKSKKSVISKSPEEERRELTQYFDLIFSVSGTNDKYSVYKEHKDAIHMLFTNDAKVNLESGGIKGVNEFIIEYITKNKTVSSFSIKGHQNGKISYISIK